MAIKFSSIRLGFADREHDLWRDQQKIGVMRADGKKAAVHVENLETKEEILVEKATDTMWEIRVNEETVGEVLAVVPRGREYAVTVQGLPLWKVLVDEDELTLHCERETIATCKHTMTWTKHTVVIEEDQAETPHGPLITGILWALWQEQDRSSS